MHKIRNCFGCSKIVQGYILPTDNIANKFKNWTFALGTGVYEFPSDDSQGRVKFEGQLKNGLPHGHGRLFYKKGGKSEGKIFNFQREGCTVFTYPENDEKLRYCSNFLFSLPSS